MALRPSQREAVGIGARLRKERESRSLSQHELARRAGISQTAVSQIESGDRPDPGAETIAALERGLGEPRVELTPRAGLLSHTLRSAREARGLSIKALAAKAEIDPKLLEDLETGIGPALDWGTILRLELALGEPRVRLQVFARQTEIDQVDGAITVFAGSELASSLKVTDHEIGQLRGAVARIFLGFIEPLTIAAILLAVRAEQSSHGAWFRNAEAKLRALGRKLGVADKTNRTEVDEVLARVAKAIGSARGVRSIPLLTKLLREIVEELEHGSKEIK